MNTYRAELDFLISILRNFHINTHFIRGGKPDRQKIDMGIREYLKMENDYNTLFSFRLISENTVCKITDTFFCNYIFLVLPFQPTQTALVIGPFTNISITKQMLLHAAEKYSIPPAAFSQIEKYYTNIPVITNESTLFAIINAFGEKLWGSLENFSVKSVKHTVLQEELNKTVQILKEPTHEDTNLSLKILESRYAKENELLEAVAKGLVNKAELMISNTSYAQIEQRISDPIRSLKNYTIVLNTLLRKAAEKGGVHPLQIDMISSGYAKRIELTNSIEAIGSLQREMVKGYTLLVRDNSVKSLSPPIKQIILHIEHDLTADLSLKKFAEMLSINPSYLSSLFKRETGLTLTEYVTKKRMEHATELLKDTKLQIQTVAQQCGILDVNYFTKAFKKLTGKTPSEYRKE